MAFKLFGDKSGDGKPADEKQSKTEADELLDKFSAAMDERLKPLQETVTTLKGKWDAIEEEAKRASEPPAPDPKTLTPEEQAKQREQALFMMTVAANARITEAECISSVAARWPALVDTIKQKFADTPVQRKAMQDYPQYCQNIVSMVVGEAAMKSGLSYDQRGSRFYIEDSSGKGGGEDNPLADPALAWQDPQSGRVESATQTLKKLGIDPNTFADSMKRGVV